MEMTDVCFAPVLSLEEAPKHPHNVERQTFVEVGGAVQPAPAPRYSATRNDPPRAAPQVGGDADAVLADLGYAAGRIAALRDGGAGRSRRDTRGEAGEGGFQSVERGGKVARLTRRK